MAASTKKIPKTFRLDPLVVSELEKLVEIHQQINDEHVKALYGRVITKKVTMTDVIEMLIRNEYQIQVPE